MLAISIDRGSAAEELTIVVGDAVRLGVLAETGGVTASVELRRGPAGR
jgi:hypothetical protein